MGAASNRSHALPDQAGGVWHGPDHRDRFCKNGFHETRAHARRDGDQHMARRQVIRHLSQNLLHRLRLDAQQDDVRRPHSFSVGERNLDPEFLLNQIYPFAMRRSGDELIPLYNARIPHPANQCFAELSRSNNSNLCPGQHAVPFPCRRIIVS